MNGWKLSTASVCAKSAKSVKKGIVAASVAIIMIGASAAGARADATTWTVVPSPNATLSGGKIESVSCSAPQACTAVGTNLDTSGINVTLAERWDGTSWQRQPTPNPPNDTSPSVAPDLQGVSCPASSFCVAVGTYESQDSGVPQVAMAQTWNGTTWSMQPFPVPPDSDGATLTGVSCTSPSFCEAVGSYFDLGLPDFPENVTLAATWDGTSWTLQSTPNPGGFNFEQFNTVSCASTTFCEAWASGNNGNPGITLADQWNGTSWQTQNVPTDASVTSLSCASAKFCEAVGQGPAYGWDGSAWTAQTIPDPAGSGSLAGVSCVSRGFCEAVGAVFTNGNVDGDAAVWRGSSWSSQTAANPAKSTFEHLNGVSCTLTVSCEAGGYFEVNETSNDPKAVAEGWNGQAWQLQHAVKPPGATLNSLSAISCVSAIFCEAVGTHFDNTGNEVNLAQTWNGQSWTIQSTPNPVSQFGGTGNSLFSVSCTATDFCEAVGAGGDGATTEMWNGTSWTVQTRPGAADVQPQSVSCVSASFCMTADGFANVDLWDGSSWASGPKVTGFSVVDSVSCVSASFCMAVGGGPQGEGAALWDGTSWTDEATPGTSVALLAVSCTAASSCEAVGQVFDPTSRQVASIAEVWDGSAWTIQPTPNPAMTQQTALEGVSCTSATSCTAVGDYQSSNVTTFGALQTVAEVWDGTSWTLRTTPNPSTSHALLSGVSCGAIQTCMAVGQTEDQGGVGSTLIETGD